MTKYPGMVRDMLMAFLRGKALFGKELPRFETKAAEIFGVKHAIAVSSGRFGMRIIMEKLGLRPGDEVILPAYTQVELPAVIIDAGFVPVLADVSPGDVNCSAVQIAEKITDKTRMILMTHINGGSGDVDGILALAKEKNLLVVEDNAHGIGVKTRDGRHLGSLGRAGFTSLETRKVVNTFGGGLVLTSDDELARAIREVVDPLKPSLKKLIKRIVSVLAEDASLSRLFAPLVVRLLHSEFFNRKMIGLYRKIHRGNRDVSVGFTNLQAILGLRQLELLTGTIRRRTDIARAYLNGLANVRKSVLDQRYMEYLREQLFVDSPVLHNGYTMIVFGNDTKTLAKTLLSVGIDVGVGEDTCEDLPARYDPDGQYPNTKLAIKHGIQLPIYSNMTDEEVKKVCAGFGESTVP